jgi:hypothetical protein
MTTSIYMPTYDSTPVGVFSSYLMFRSIGMKIQQAYPDAVIYTNPDHQSTGDVWYIEEVPGSLSLTQGIGRRWIRTARYQVSHYVDNVLREDIYSYFQRVKDTLEVLFLYIPYYGCVYGEWGVIRNIKPQNFTCNIDPEGLHYGFDTTILLNYGDLWLDYEGVPLPDTPEDIYIQFVEHMELNGK